jgi:hypothetical protein
VTQDTVGWYAKQARVACYLSLPDVRGTVSSYGKTFLRHKGGGVSWKIPCCYQPFADIEMSILLQKASCQAGVEGIDRMIVV